MSARAEPATEEALPDELTIVFKKPIEGPAGPVSQIDLREPTAGEIMLWDQLSGAEADAKAISVVAGIPPSVVAKMPARDFYKSARFLGSFLL